jgi:hypothetical protein
MDVKIVLRFPVILLSSNSQAFTSPLHPVTLFLTPNITLLKYLTPFQPYPFSKHGFQLYPIGFYTKNDSSQYVSLHNLRTFATHNYKTLVRKNYVNPKDFTPIKSKFSS